MATYERFKELLKDPEITEIMVNGTRGIFIEKFGQKRELDFSFENEQEVMEIIKEIFSSQGKRIDKYRPYADVCLEDGTRVNAIIPPLARQGPSITIRKFSTNLKSLDDLVANHTLTEKAAKFLIACIKGKLNILISGATGSGKTTTLEMLSYHIPEEERIITIEDTAELKIHHKNLVSLETRDPDEEGKGEVTLRHLIKNALRMRPDRIILGEVRGEEALDLIQAMSTGHRGTLAVIHGNSPSEVLARLETLILSSGIKLPPEEIRKMIAQTINIVIQQEQLSDGSRKITHIAELRGIERGEIVVQDIFAFKMEGKTPEGKIKGRLKSVMRMYPKFFSEFQKLGLLDEKVFSDG